MRYPIDKNDYIEAYEELESCVADFETKEFLKALVAVQNRAYAAGLEDGERLVGHGQKH